MVISVPQLKLCDNCLAEGLSPPSPPFSTPNESFQHRDLHCWAAVSSNRLTPEAGVNLSAMLALNAKVVSALWQFLKNNRPLRCHGYWSAPEWCAFRAFCWRIFSHKALQATRSSLHAFLTNHCKVCRWLKGAFYNARLCCGRITLKWAKRASTGLVLANQHIQ